MERPKGALFKIATGYFVKELKCYPILILQQCQSNGLKQKSEPPRRAVLLHF